GVEEREGGGERVLPPTLQPLKEGSAVGEQAALVDGVEPAGESELLIGEGEGAVAARLCVIDVQPPGAELRKLPSERVLGHGVGVILDGPGRANNDGLPVVGVEGRRLSGGGAGGPDTTRDARLSPSGQEETSMGSARVSSA